MERQIVVPLDGSELAEHTLPYAAALARATNSALQLIRVMPPGRSLLAFGEPALLDPDACRRWEAEETAAAGIYLADITRRLIASGVVTRHQVIVAEDVAAAIVKHAQEHPQVELIAMATHGRSGVRHFLLGSVAEQVLRRTPVPLLLVRPTGERVESIVYRTIVVPLDGSSFAERALEPAERIAAATQAEVLLIAIAPSIDPIGLAKGEVEPPWRLAEHEPEVACIAAYLQRQVERLRHAGVAARAFTLSGDPAPTIVQFSVEHAADLIVMATHGRGGLARLLLGSVANAVLHQARLPIMLVRPVDQAESFRHS